MQYVPLTHEAVPREILEAFLTSNTSRWSHYHTYSEESPGMGICVYCHRPQGELIHCPGAPVNPINFRCYGKLINTIDACRASPYLDVNFSDGQYVIDLDTLKEFAEQSKQCAPRIPPRTPVGYDLGMRYTFSKAASVVVEPGDTVTVTPTGSVRRTKPGENVMGVVIQVVYQEGKPDIVEVVDETTWIRTHRVPGRDA